MTTTTTSRYDVSEHLRTPEEMAAYLEASFEASDGDAAFIAKALGDIARLGATDHNLTTNTGGRCHVRCLQNSGTWICT